jgi:hypothetical protein
MSKEPGHTHNEIDGSRGDVDCEPTVELINDLFFLKSLAQGIVFRLCSMIYTIRIYRSRRTTNDNQRVMLQA